MTTRLLSQQKPQTASWSKGAPPPRPATAEDWERAPRLCSLAWAVWLVGMHGSTFSQLMARDPLLRDRLSYRAPSGGQRWRFTDRVRARVAAPKVSGLQVVRGKTD